MSEFVQTYRSLVIPRLKQRFEICAALIVSGVSGFDEEMRRLEDQARRLGGTRLPEQVLADLEAWIANQLIAAVCNLEIRQTIPGAQRDVIAQFLEQEAVIAALTEEIERLRADLATAWTLAATAPAKELA